MSFKLKHHISVTLHLHFIDKLSHVEKYLLYMLMMLIKHHLSAKSQSKVKNLDIDVNATIKMCHPIINDWLKSNKLSFNVQKS